MLDQLYEEGVLRHETREYLSSCSNPEECCGKLLDHLLGKDDIEKSLAVFKEILQKDHPWIYYNMIWRGSSDVSDPNNRPLSEDERRRIIFNNRCLIKLIDPYKHEFLSDLVEKDCITFRHFRKLTSMSEVDKSEMISELFTILLRRSFAHFQLFIQCLKFTLQHNLVQILESNGIVLIMQVNLENKNLEKQIADTLTGKVRTDNLNLGVKDKKLIEDTLKSLEEKELVIVGGECCDSLIIHILCKSLNAVNEMEKSYKAKELENTLTTVTMLNVTIHIDNEEFTRCRRFLSEGGIESLKCLEDHRVLRCERLNDMPLEIFDVTLKQTSWMMWVCFLISTLQPCSTTPMKEYLEEGIRGFSNFVKVSSSNIYRELSSVCIGWRNLLQNERYGKSIRSELLSRITRLSIKKSKKILIECLDAQDGLLDLFLNEKLITSVQKNDCESMPAESSKIFVGILRRATQPFAKLLKFLRLLKKQCKSHLVNHVISFGVHWPSFEKKWPLDKMTKLLIAAWGHDITYNINSVRYIVTVNMLFEESISYDLVQLLFENCCITVEKRNQLKQLQDPQKTKILMKLLKHGSVEMFEIAIDYFKLTGQDEIVDVLQLVKEVDLCFKHIINCLNGAEEILQRMAGRTRLVSSLLKKFSINGFSDRLKKFQKNELLLTILSICDADLNEFFMNFLLTSNQHVLLIPVLRNDSHSEVIKEYESYLIDSINADEELLLKLVDLNVINRSQMRAIVTKKTFMKRNKTLLRVISKASFKSFNFFLTALAQPCRSNILESMRPEPCKPSENDSSVAGSGIADKQVEMVADTGKETNLISNFIGTEPYVESMDSEDDLRDSDEILQPLRFETDQEMIEFTLEKDNNSGSMNEINPWSSLDLSRFLNESLPDDIQSLVFLKIVAISQLLPAYVDNPSQHLSSLLVYLSNNIYNQERLCSYYTVDRMKDKRYELTMRAVVESLYDTLTTVIDPFGYILETLVEYRVLTSRDISELKAYHSSKSRAELLLSILFTSEHLKAFRVFVKALQRYYPAVVQMINDASTGKGPLHNYVTPKSAVFDPPTHHVTIINL